MTYLQKYDLFQPHRQGMRVLVACEYSGIVRNAFLARNHDGGFCISPRKGIVGIATEFGT